MTFCDTITIEEWPADVYVDTVDVPSSSYVGETFTILAIVGNDGGLQGSGTVTFTQEGSEIGSVEVTLDPGEFKNVELDHSIDSAGDYQICAGI